MGQCFSCKLENIFSQWKIIAWDYRVRIYCKISRNRLNQKYHKTSTGSNILPSYCLCSLSALVKIIDITSQTWILFYSMIHFIITIITHNLLLWEMKWCKPYNSMGLTVILSFLCGEHIKLKTSANFDIVKILTNLCIPRADRR